MHSNDMIVMELSISAAMIAFSWLAQRKSMCPRWAELEVVLVRQVGKTNMRYPMNCCRWWIQRQSIPGQVYGCSNQSPFWARPLPLTVIVSMSLVLSWRMYIRRNLSHSNHIVIYSGCTVCSNSLAFRCCIHCLYRHVGAGGPSIERPIGYPGSATMVNWELDWER